MQAERYTIAWFVWPRDGAVIQGPKKRYPPTTMRDFMKARASLNFLEGPARLLLCFQFMLSQSHIAQMHATGAVTAVQALTLWCIYKQTCETNYATAEV